MSFLYWIYWWALPSCLRPHLTRKAEWYKGRTLLRKLGLKVLVLWEVSIPNFVFSSVQWGQEQLAALRTAWGLRETVLVRGPLRTQAGGLIDKMHVRIRTPQILFSFTRYRSDRVKMRHEDEGHGRTFRQANTYMSCSTCWVLCWWMKSARAGGTSKSSGRSCGRSRLSLESAGDPSSDKDTFTSCLVMEG